MLARANHYPGFHQTALRPLPSQLLFDAQAHYLPIPLTRAILNHPKRYTTLKANLFHAAATPGSLAQFIDCLAQGADISHQYQGQNILTIAGGAGHVDVVQALLTGISLGRAPVLRVNPLWVDSFGDSVLHASARTGRLEVFSFALLAAQQYVSTHQHCFPAQAMAQLAVSKNSAGDTPASIAAKHNQVAILRCLAEYVNFEPSVLSACIRYAPGFESLDFLVRECGMSCSEGAVAPIEHLAHFDDPRALCGFLRSARTHSESLYEALVTQCQTTANTRVRAQFERAVSMLEYSDRVNSLPNVGRTTGPSG